MNANEIVEKIRNNIPTRGFEYTYPNEKYMIAEIQKLLDKGIEVNVVDKPIVKHEDKRILLHSFYIVEGILCADNVKSVFIWCWYIIVFNEKELINIGFDYK